MHCLRNEIMRSRNTIILSLMIIKSFVFAGELKVISEPSLLVGGADFRVSRPLWSPDGSRIAFTRPNYQGIWVMDPSSGQVDQITDEQSAGFGFQWSSDSKAIVSRVSRLEGRYTLHVLKVFDLEGGTSRQISDFRSLMPGTPRWVDADEKVLMCGRGRVEFFDSGKKTDPLKKQSTERPLCFLKGTQIAVGSVGIKEYRLFEPVPGATYINLTVSPDASKVAFEVLGGNLYAMHIDGSGLVDLGRGHRPHWAPDNETLVYMFTYDDGHKILASDIYAIKADGSENTRLTTTDEVLEMNPSWSPDGKTIAFDVMEEGAIYVIEVSR